MSNPNFDQILSTTFKNYVESKLADNVFAARPLFYFLSQSGNIRTVNGGQSIVIPILHGKNTTVASYSGSDTISTTAQTGITAAEFPWKQLAASVVITGIEKAQNNGPQQIVDLVEAKAFQAKESIADSLNVMLYADGTGNSGKDYMGLAGIVNNTGTIGGIDGGTHAYWRSYVEATAAQLQLSQMQTAYNSVSRGADQPNVVITTQALYERYASLLQPQLRIASSETWDAGFVNLVFNGVPVTYDADCQSGRMYFLNTKHLRLVGHSENWFRTTPFMQPTNQDIMIAQILLYGNLTVSNRARQGVLTNKTA